MNPFNGQSSTPENGPQPGRRLRARWLIETGTFIGSTTRFFSGNGVPVFTCEIKRAFWLVARMRIGWRTDVAILRRDSRAMLESVARQRTGASPALSRRSLVERLPAGCRARPDTWRLGGGRRSDRRLPRSRRRGLRVRRLRRTSFGHRVDHPPFRGRGRGPGSAFRGRDGSTTGDAVRGKRHERPASSGPRDRARTPSQRALNHAESIDAVVATRDDAARQLRCSPCRRSPGSPR